MENFYEITLLFRYDLSVQDVQKNLSNIKDIIQSHECKVLYSEYWGLRALQYKIKKNSSAHFYFFQITASKDVLDTLEEKIKINETIIRHFVVSINKDELNIQSGNVKERDIKLSEKINDHEDMIVFEDKYKNILATI